MELQCCCVIHLVLHAASGFVHVRASEGYSSVGQCPACWGCEDKCGWLFFSLSSLLKEQNQPFLTSGVAWARLCVLTLYIILDGWNEQVSELAIGDQVCNLSLDSDEEVRDEGSIEFSVGSRPLCKSGGGRRKHILFCNVSGHTKQTAIGKAQTPSHQYLEVWENFKKTTFLLPQSIQKRTAPDWLSDSSSSPSPLDLWFCICYNHRWQPRNCGSLKVICNPLWSCVCPSLDNEIQPAISQLTWDI